MSEVPWWVEYEQLVNSRPDYLNYPPPKYWEPYISGPRLYDCYYEVEINGIVLHTCVTFQIAVDMWRKVMRNE